MLSHPQGSENFEAQNPMKTLLAPVLWTLMACGTATAAEQFVYHGTWNTTNRQLDGAMTCVVAPLGRQQWQGRFYGTWQGVDFDHTVDFNGPADDLRGTAVIDGAAYEWRGSIDRLRMRANFGGDRYAGSFDLSRQPSAPLPHNPRATSASR